MPEENDHSLKMQIEADFGIAASNANTFEERMASIDKVVDDLSRKISTIRDGGNALEKGVAKSVDDIYKQIKEGAFQLDGQDIRKALEKRIASAIGERGIHIKDLADSDGALNVTLGTEATERLRTEMGNELSKLAGKMKISGLNKGKMDIPINDETVQNIQKKFNDKLKEAVSKNINFVMENDEVLETFHVKTSNMNHLLQQVRKKFFEVLNDPKMVQVDDSKLKPISISSKEIDSAMDNIRKAIGSIDAQFGTDITKQLADLPNVKDKIKDFQKHTASLFTELQETIDAIDKMNPDEKNYGRLKYEAGRMRNMIIQSGTSIISDITRMFDEQMKTGGQGGDIGKEAIANLDGIKSHLNNYIKGMADNAYDVMTKELNMVKKSEGGKEFFAPSVQKLQQAIVDASKEALKNLNAGDMKIDTTAVKAVFDNWATQTSQQLMANSFATLSDLQSELISSNKKVMNAYVKSLKKLASLEFTPTNATGEKITVDIDEAKIRKEIQAKMREVANQLTSNVDFTPGAKNSLDAGLTLTKKQVDGIQTQVASILQSQLGRLGDQIGNRVGKDFDSSLLEKFDKQVFDESKKLVTTMVEQANGISRAITSGMDSSGFKALTSDEQNQIKARFQDAGAKMVTDFSSMMDNALSSFMIASSVTEEVKKKLQSKIESIVKNTNITFEDSKTPLVLQGLVADVQRELQTAIKMNVEAWTPDLVAFDPKINFKSVFDNINKAINTQLSRASDDIIRMVGEQSNPLRDKGRQTLVEGELRAKGDMSLYAKEKLAGNNLKQIEEQGFKYLDKTERGFEYKLADPDKLSDDFARIMTEMNSKFSKKANEVAEKIRNENIAVSKQKIVSVLSPIRDGVTTYLSLYAQAVGEAIKGIKPTFSGKSNIKQLESALEGTNDVIKNYISTTVGAMRNISPTTGINSKDLHADVRKLFAQEFDVTVADWEKAFPRMDDDGSYLREVMQRNVQAIMNKFHDTVALHTKSAIKTYADELGKVNIGPRTESVNYLAMAMHKIQDAFDQKIQQWVNNQVGAVTGFLQNNNFKLKSIGATQQDMAPVAATTLGRQPVNYGSGLPFPDFGGGGGGQRSMGFNQEPGNSTWFNGVQERFDADWNNINEWVNQRLLDGLNTKNAIKGKVPKELQDHLFDYIDNHYNNRVKEIGSTPFDPNDQDAGKELKRQMLSLVQDLKLATSWVKGIKNDGQIISNNESMAIQQEGLRYQTDRFRDNGFVPQGRIDDVRVQIDSATTANDLKKIRQELTKLRDLQADIKKDQERERKQGNLVAQNEVLKGNNALQAESLQALLRTVPALQNYNVEQLKVNSSTNAWSARLRDAEGNVRSLQGTVDRATGSLYQHSEAISNVVNQSARLASMSGPRYGNGGNLNNTYYPTNYNGGGGGKEHNPNGDFTSSVVNTMRYMTAGAVMGVPSMMMYDAWESNKEFDYQMERARQNFVIKGDLDPSKRMYDVAEERVLTQNPGLDVSSEKGAVLIEAERQMLLGLSGQIGDDSKQVVENLAMKYRIDIEKAAQAFHISSRLLDDPNEAFAMTSAIVKANSIEEMDIETGTKGMEAIKSQWGIKGNDYEEVMNMMIMAANRTPATVEDLLATQQRSGSIFRDALPDMSKRDAISTSIGLSAMFNQATARSGKEGGTFFKTILQSPFTEKGSKALREYSIQSGFEDLDPYNQDGSQKNFVDVFSSIMEHSLKMSPEQKRSLWSSIFPQWHQGSAGAIETFMSEMVTDMQKNMEQVKVTSGSEADTDKDGEISVKEAFQDYFNNIKNVEPEAIDEMVNGNAQTWKQQQQLLATTFQATMRGIFDSLKDEFGLMSSYLLSYMRAVKDNTESVTAAISLASKLAIGAGGRYAYSKISGRLKESNKQVQTKRFEQLGGGLFEERRAHNLRRIGLNEELAVQGGRRTKINKRRGEVVDQLNLNDLSLANLRGDRNLSRNSRQNMINLQNTTGDDHSSAIRAMDEEINRLNRDINKLEISSSELDSELEKLKLEEQAVTNATDKLNRELDESGNHMRSVNNRIDALADSMDDLGLDGQQLRSQVEKLNKEFKDGTTDINRYQAEISEMASDAGMSEQSLGKLLKQVDKLNKEFSEGTLKADQYAAKIKELERAHKLGTNGVNGGGVGGSGAPGQSGMGLMEMVVAGSLLTGGVKMGRNVFQRLGDARRTGSLRTAFGGGGAMTDRDGNQLMQRNPDGTTSNRPILMGDVLAEDRLRTGQDPANKKWYQKGVFGKIGGVASKFNNMGRLGTALKLSKGLGWTAIAGEGLMKGFDLASSVFQEDYEKKDIQARKLDELNQQAQNLKYGGVGQKLVGGLSMAGDLTFGALNNLMGGNEASFGQVWDAMTTKSSSKEDLQKKLDEEFQTKKLREEAKTLEEEYRKRTDPDYVPLEETLDENTEELDAAQEAIDSLTTAVSELNTTMNRQLGMNEAQYTIDSTKLLLSGEKADSEQMRKLMKDLLEKNNTVLETTLAELRSKMGNVSDKESETYKDMELQEKQLESQVVENQYKLKQNNMSEFDAIMNSLSENLDATEDEYGIQESQAKLGGATEDSPVLKKIESAKVNSSNAQIEQAQTDLTNLVAKLGLKENDPDYLKIQGAIRDLEKQQLDNLVAIKSNLDKSKGSFNLPSGIEVKDYMSHAMTNNTHKNVTTRMGDTVVNVTIDNMSGSQKDVQKMTDSLADAVKKANQQANSNFNKQVWSGMGANYTSPY